MEDRTLQLMTCSRCGAWERVSLPAPGAVLVGDQPRWSDGFHPHAAGPRAVRCPSCREVHLPLPLGDGPSSFTCLATLAGSGVAAIVAASRAQPEALRPLVFLGAFLLAATLLGLCVAAVEAAVCGGVRALRARRRRVQLAADASPDEVIDALRTGLATNGEDELALRRGAWWSWNHHDRLLPALGRDEVERRVAAAGQAAGWTGPRVTGLHRLRASSTALELLARPVTVDRLLRLDAALAEAAARAVARGPGSTLELDDLPADLRAAPAPVARPVWWEENLRRLIDLQGATTPEERRLKAEAARMLGDRALALRLLEGETRADGREVRGWYQLLVEGDDPRVAQLPVALAAKLPPPEDDCVRC